MMKLFNKKNVLMLSVGVILLVFCVWNLVHASMLKTKMDGLLERENEAKRIIEQDRTKSNYLTDAQSDNDLKAGSERINPINYVTAIATRKPLVEAMSYDGIFEPNRVINIFPKVPGLIDGAFAEVGDKVNKDMVLMQLGTQEIDKNIQQAQAGVSAAKAQLELANQGARKEEVEQVRDLVEQAQAMAESANSAYERIKYLYENDIISRQDFEKVEMEKKLAQSQLSSAKKQLEIVLAGARKEQVEAAEAQLKQANAMLELALMKRDDTTIKSPAEGIVAHRQGEVGELVASVMPVFSIIEIDPIKVSISVAERDISRIFKGQEVELVLRAFSGKTFKGEVVRVAPAVDQANRLFKVDINVENSEELIKPGMYAQLQIVSEGKSPYPAIPVEALEQVNGKNYVYVIADGNVERRMVQIGKVEGQWQQITEGLLEGEKVLVDSKGEYFLDLIAMPKGANR